MNKQTSMAVVLCALLAGFSQAKAQVTCGDVITTPAVLTSNLSCQTPDPALTIVGPNGSLDVRGFTLSCKGSSIIGIELTGSGARLQNGTVRDCINGVVAVKSGNHVVQQMTVRNNSVGVFIFSSGNQITNTTVRDNSGNGFHVGSETNNVFSRNAATNNRQNGFFAVGSNHNFTNNTATGNGSDGFDLQGGGNTLSQNIAQSNRLDGFSVSSSNNTLTSNVARNNLDRGINVLRGVTDNQLRQNAASGNGNWDLRDDNLNCDANIWQFNSGTRNQGCIR